MLTTKRLILRDFQENDWMPFHEYATNTEANRYRVHEAKTVEDSKIFITNAIERAAEKTRTDYEFGVFSQINNEFIGVAELYIENFHHAPNFDGSQARIGYGLHPRFWGRGFATEAVEGLISYGFQHLRLHRIYAPVTPANIASVRVLEKVGMRREAHFRESLLMKGEWVDVLLFAVLAREFANR